MFLGDSGFTYFRMQKNPQNKRRKRCPGQMAFGVDIVTPSGQTFTAPENYKLSSAEKRYKRVLEYLALEVLHPLCGF